MLSERISKSVVPVPQKPLTERDYSQTVVEIPTQLPESSSHVVVLDVRLGQGLTFIQVPFRSSYVDPAKIPSWVVH